MVTTLSFQLKNLFNIKLFKKKIFNKYNALNEYVKHLKFNKQVLQVKRLL